MEDLTCFCEPQCEEFFSEEENNRGMIRYEDVEFKQEFEQFLDEIDQQFFENLVELS
jgi:hypothetical protein